MAWTLTHEAGALRASYDGGVVLEEIALSCGEADADVELALEPYGEPYAAPAPGGDHIIHHFFAPSHPGVPAPGILLEVGCGPTRIYFRIHPIVREKVYEVRAKVRCGPEPYLCRTQCASDVSGVGMVQAGLGPVESVLCDSLFDKWKDRLLRFGSDGERRILRDRATGAFRVETRMTAIFGSTPDLLSVQAVEHFITESRGMPYYKPFDRTARPLPPSGWESWYCYGSRTSEELLVTIADWLHDNLTQFGCEVVQWDDGYQGESWLEWKKDLFPRGPKWIAQHIRSRGFTPGIWVVPQSLGNVDSKHLISDPAWILKDPKGETFRAFGNYPYVDPTRPEVKKDWFQKIFRTMAVEWGIDFFKIDGQGEMHRWYAFCRDLMFDQSVTPDEAYRGMLRVIRDAIGPERTLLICATEWRAMGFGDACRTGADVGERWPAAEPALRATFTSYWMHTIAWYNDPDVLIVRPTLTLEQARSWASLLGLSGQVLLDSDPVHELPEERVELLRRVFPAQDIRPMDLWPRPPHGPYPQIWDLKVAKAWGSWDVVGLFRWYEENKPEVRISTEGLGLQPGRYVLYDVWEKAYLGELGEGRTFQLKPESCRVVCVRPLAAAPTLLGTNRHITQGYPDLEALSMKSAETPSPRTCALSGESRLVARDPYEIRILTEIDGRKHRCAGVAAPGVNLKTRQEGPVLIVAFESPTSRKVSWQVRFES